jgi:hypothetical protein
MSGFLAEHYDGRARPACGALGALVDSCIALGRIPMEKRSKAAAPAMAVTITLLLPLGVYSAGYFWLCPSGKFGNGTEASRIYESKSLARIFAPAAAVEGCVTGCPVSTGWYMEP